MTNLRVGLGYDVHQLQEGKPFILGGVQLDHHKGAVGHSDADVLIHAMCDALLGAANLRDIGFHFPDTDPAYKGIDSKELLKQVMVLLKEHSYSVVNIDATVALQQPKIKSHIPTMINVLSETMGVDERRVSIKATTTEKLGFEGREEGVSAQVVVLIELG